MCVGMVLLGREGKGKRNAVMHKRTWMSLKCSSILFIFFGLTDTIKNSLKAAKYCHFDLFGTHSGVF